jgi:hypothetical protein
MGVWIRPKDETGKYENVARDCSMPYSSFNKVIVTLCAEIAGDVVADNVQAYRQDTRKVLLSKTYLDDKFDIIHWIAEWYDTEGELTWQECLELAERTDGIMFTNEDVLSFREVLKYCAEEKQSLVWN